MQDQEKTKDQLIDELNEMRQRVAEFETGQKSLNENQSRYREIIDKTSEAIFVIQEGWIKFANEKSAEIVGYSMEEILASNAIEAFVHPDDREMVAQHHASRLREDEEFYQYDFRIVLKAGNVRRVKVTSSSIMWEGKPAVLSILDDITERMQAETTLLERERHFLSLLETIPDALVVYDDRGKVTFVNKAFEQLYGWSTEELVGKPLSNFVPPSEEQITRQAWERTLRGENVVFETQRWTKNSKTLNVQLATAILRDMEGRHTSSIVIHQDITSRKRAEEEIHRSEQKYRQIFDHSPLGILHFDYEGTITTCNDNFVQIIGSSREKLAGLNMVNDLKDVKIVAAVKRALSGHIGHYEGEYASVTADKVTPVKVDFSPLLNENGVVIGGIGVTEDITERKMAEDEVRNNEARLEKIVDILHYKADSVQDFLDNALNEALELTHSEIGYIFHYNEDSEEFELHTWSKDAMKQCSILKPQTVYQLKATGIWGEAVRQGKPILVNDFQAQHPLKKGYPDGHPRLHRYLTVPVFSADRIVAVVGVANKESEYNQADTLQLTLLMDSVWKGVDRLQAEEQLRESEATLKTVLQSAPIGIGLVTNRIFGWTNESLSQMTGYSAADLLGRSARILYENDDEFVRIGTVKYGQINAGGAGSVETRWKCKDGSVIDILLSSSAITPEDLSRGVVFSAIDITERRRSEQDLREAEERMRLLLKSAPIAIRIATQGKYSYANPAFLNMFGYSCLEEIDGLPVEALYVDEDRRLIWERNAIRAKGLTVDPHYHVTGIRKDGAHIDLEAWGSEISYQGKRSTFRFLIDVTEANSLRAQLLQAQKMEAVGTLAGGVAHDFNNLLQSVLGYSELMLQRKKEGERDYADLQKIYQAGKRGADLVESLLTFSRKVETKCVPVNLNQEIIQVQQLLSRTIPKTIKIVLRLSGDLESINADPSQISQVLMNLGVNARDAMPDGGILTIETAKVQLDKEYCSSHLEAMPGGYVLLTVSDTGHGMDKRTRAHMFEPFFSTKDVGKGTGLGLATVYGIVKQHDGHIICDSEPGHGTKFKVYLPAIQTKKELETPKLETTIPGGTETVLLVDDDGDIRELGALLLNEFGYKVITAGNGKEALEMYQTESESISLIILDLIMPEMDGRQCLGEILQIDPTVKVLIASGYSESGSAIGATVDGAKGFVQKPYNMRQLLTAVREILDNDLLGAVNTADGS